MAYGKHLSWCTDFGSRKSSCEREDKAVILNSGQLCSFTIRFMRAVTMDLQSVGFQEKLQFLFKRRSTVILIRRQGENHKCRKGNVEGRNRNLEKHPHALGTRKCVTSSVTQSLHLKLIREWPSLSYIHSYTISKCWDRIQGRDWWSPYFSHEAGIPLSLCFQSGRVLKSCCGATLVEGCKVD